VLRSIYRLFGTDVAIDLGTANTLIYLKDEGLVLAEPSVVAVCHDGLGNQVVHSVGNQAKSMLGRAPDDVSIVRPIRDGVISNFDVTKAMLKHLMRRIRDRVFVWRPRLVIAVPAGLNDVERRAVKEAARATGASEVFLIEEAVAAAIGAGCDVTAPEATMVVDIGGGTTEIALISCSGLIYSHSTRIGGDSLDQAIAQYVRHTYNLLIGDLTAERIKIELGGERARDQMRCMSIKGRDLIGGSPKTIEIKAEEVHRALADAVGLIVECVRVALEEIPPETSADIAEAGILLVGGGSLLGSLATQLQARTGLPVHRAENPLTTVALGAGRCLEDDGLRASLTVRQ
jgi:rod shape-determining protein MreB